MSLVMARGKNSLGVLFLTAILCVSFIPQGVAAQDASVEHYAFGMEYDWTNLNDDMESMTGLPLDDILLDIMNSAEDAGIGLVILEELTGTSSMVVDQYEDGTTMFSAVDGTTVEVTRHVTELTVRHGSVQDMAVITDWGDSYAGWELTMSASSETMLNLDAMYVEFRDGANMVHGHDLELTMNVFDENELGLVGSLEANDGDDVMPLDIGASISVGYEIKTSQSEVVYTEPSNIHNALANLGGGEEITWEVGDIDDDEDDDYYDNEAWWMEYNYCEWEGDDFNGDNRYYCTYNDDGSNGFDDWWFYCEYKAYDEIYYCTDDFGQNSDWEFALSNTHFEDGTSPAQDEDNHSHDDEYDGELHDDVESHTGSFSTATTFEFELTGLPVEELGLPAGDWDVSVTDTVTDSGNFDEEYECEMWMELFDETQTITTDSGSMDVLSGYGSPMPFGMTCHVGNLVANAFIGTEDAPTLLDLVEDSTDEITDSMGSETYDSENSNLMYMSADAYSMDEIDVHVEAWDLDENTNYEIDLVMYDEGGTLVDVHSMSINNRDHYWDNVYMSADAYGVQCITATLSNSDTNTEMDSAEVCVNVAKEMEPSDLLISIAEGFSESTLENAMESFASNLENRLSNYEADVQYHDADMRVLWDTSTNRAVGFQMLVYDEDVEEWYTMVGPESDMYPEAPVLMSFEYFSGQSAIEQETVIDQQTSIEDLVDLTQHDVSDLEEAVGDAFDESGDQSEGTANETEAGDGLLPFVSPTFTVMVIAIAGLVASLRSREQE